MRDFVNIYGSKLSFRALVAGAQYSLAAAQSAYGDNPRYETQRPRRAIDPYTKCIVYCCLPPGLVGRLVRNFEH